ncbi:cation efflux family-domain-containing protein [Lineolata rhizophorae]|uniref:Cation efflux family-domain-containing protein n=1 Tax=Lineolata rhizophorae TaxID=578093 RepID=A0A6A6PD24_9PEZI|nr:cation efflux family-domain-containing protein [Lineolata rhizophorae]
MPPNPPGSGRSPDPDLHHALSFRPHPFHHDSSSRNASPRPSSAASARGRLASGAVSDRRAASGARHVGGDSNDDNLAADNARPAPVSTSPVSATPAATHETTAAPMEHYSHRGSDDDAATATLGTTTAYEAVPPEADLSDPISRHPTITSARAVTPRDVENQQSPTYTSENDPYRLASHLKSASEIEHIKANTSKKRDGGAAGGLLSGLVHNREAGRGAGVEAAPSTGANNEESSGFLSRRKKQWRARKIQGFYENQNANIERLLRPVDEHVRQAREAHGENELRLKLAVTGSFAANVILSVLQVYAAVSSGSLSLFTTMADSLFDPLSNLMLILSNRAVNRVDPRKFPSGKARIETAGNIFFCFLMIAVSILIVVQSVQDLVGGSDEDTKNFHLPAVIAVAIAFSTKLTLFFYCFALRNMYSQVRILWEDHRNDLLINGFGILTSVGGSKLKWWIDPTGAIALSLIIIVLWSRTAWSEFQLLIGVTADPSTLQLITYISMTHSPSVLALDTVRAWHSGPRLIVEVDICMDPAASLRATHDVAEALQTKLESLPDVERAYVHVDYETSHAPEHFWKKEL